MHVIGHRGNGFTIDPKQLAKDPKSSSARGFFEAVSSKPYINQIVLAPHLYCPKVRHISSRLKTRSPLHAARCSCCFSSCVIRGLLGNTGLGCMWCFQLSDKVSDLKQIACNRSLGRRTSTSHPWGSMRSTITPLATSRRRQGSAQRALAMCMLLSTMSLGAH